MSIPFDTSSGGESDSNTFDNKKVYELKTKYDDSQLKHLIELHRDKKINDAKKLSSCSADELRGLGSALAGAATAGGLGPGGSAMDLSSVAVADLVLGIFVLVEEILVQKNFLPAFRRLAICDLVCFLR